MIAIEEQNESEDVLGFQAQSVGLLPEIWDLFKHRSCRWLVLDLACQELPDSKIISPSQQHAKPYCGTVQLIVAEPVQHKKHGQ